MKKLFLIWIALVVLVPLVHAQDTGKKEKKQPDWNAPFIKVNGDAPNILWICTDQQRWNTIGALGNPYVKTPNIDRLVNEGVSFDYSFCQAPFCTASRASFLTGMYPSRVHATKNGAAEWPEAAPLVTETLKDAGYECGLAGKLHLSTAMAHRPEKRPLDDGYQVFYYSHSPYQGGSTNDYLTYYRNRGIDVLALKQELGYVPAPYHQTTWCTDRAIDFIKEKREWPWLFSLNIYDPHGPFDPPQEYLDRYQVDDLAGPLFQPSDLDEKSVFNNVMFQSKPKQYTDHENKLRLAQYWAQIDLIDENIGRILKVLEETGQLNNTLIVFTSDHGDMAGDHGLVAKGCRFYEGLVRVPLIFWYPAKFKQNLKSEALVELMDIVPTLLELTGLLVDQQIQGTSLLPILEGRTDPDEHKSFVRSEFYDDGQAKAGQIGFATMYRTKDFKLITYHGHPQGELFDLRNDPDEFHNLWDDPGYQEIKFKLLKDSFDATVLSMDTGPEKIGRY
ncbi:MAG TPA: sulfatase-like hydrolase/transferase [Saprospiraceae bacterium]|nr:sulfatase-like hydrolase/transferase [Saprospiraceae bacterium]